MCVCNDPNPSQLLSQYLIGIDSNLGGVGVSSVSDNALKFNASAYNFPSLMAVSSPKDVVSPCVNDSYPSPGPPTCTFNGAFNDFKTDGLGPGCDQLDISDVSSIGSIESKCSVVNEDNPKAKDFIKCSSSGKVNDSIHPDTLYDKSFLNSVDLVTFENHSCCAIE